MLAAPAKMHLTAVLVSVCFLHKPRSSDSLPLITVLGVLAFMTPCMGGDFMKKYCFLIGNVVFSVTAKEEFLLPKNFIPFAVSSCSASQFSATIAFGSPTPIGTVLLSSEGRTVLRSGENYVFVHELNCTPFCRCVVSSSGTSAEITLDPSANLPLGTALNFLPFGIALLPYDGLFFHAATVVLNQKAYAFTAPSGTGKSTHAALWESTFGASLLNGDRILLRKQGDCFFAYGLPVAGSSFTFVNKAYPLCGLALLSQGKENKAAKADVSAVGAMMEQADLPLFSPSWAEKALLLFDTLCKTVPLVSFSCRPNPEAAIVLKECFERMR